MGRELHLCSLAGAGTRTGTLPCFLVPSSGTLPLAGPDALVVMCIRGGVNARSDSFSDFHSLKKIEHKSSFIGNGCTKVGYLFKELYDTIVSNLM